jgi:hypothetical protein
MFKLFLADTLLHLARPFLPRGEQMALDAHRTRLEERDRAFWSYVDASRHEVMESVRRRNHRNNLDSGRLAVYVVKPPRELPKP